MFIQILRNSINAILIRNKLDKKINIVVVGDKNNRIIARKFYADRAQRVSTRRQTQDDRRLEALASTEVRRPRSYDLQLRLTEPAPRTGTEVSAR